MYISIYNDVERRLGGSAMWTRIKSTYNRAPYPARRLMEGTYIASFFVRHLLTLRNPVRALRMYEATGRGMDFYHDVRDWMGGFPYEYATAGEVFNHIHTNYGFQLEYLDTHDGHTCNEFVFRRPLACT